MYKPWAADNLFPRLQEAVKDAIAYRATRRKNLEENEAMIADYSRVQKGLDSLSETEKRKLNERLVKPEDPFNRLALVHESLESEHYDLREINCAHDINVIQRLLSTSGDRSDNVGFYVDAYWNIPRTRTMRLSDLEYFPQ